MVKNKAAAYPVVILHMCIPHNGSSRLPKLNNGNFYILERVHNCYKLGKQ